MKAAGQVAVEPVGRADRGQQPRGGTAVVAAEEQIEKDRKAGQADEGDCVGDGEQTKPCLLGGRRVLGTNSPPA